MTITTNHWIVHSVHICWNRHSLNWIIRKNDSQKRRKKTICHLNIEGINSIFKTFTHLTHLIASKREREKKYFSSHVSLKYWYRQDVYPIDQDEVEDIIIFVVAKRRKNSHVSPHHSLKYCGLMSSRSWLGWGGRRPTGVGRRDRSKRLFSWWVLFLFRGRRVHKYDKYIYLSYLSKGLLSWLVLFIFRWICKNMFHICPKDYFYGQSVILIIRLAHHNVKSSCRKPANKENPLQSLENLLFCDQYSRPIFFVSASHYQLNKLIIGLVPENLTFMKACIVDGMDFEKLTNQKQFENKLDMDIKLQFSKHYEEFWHYFRFD